MKATLTSKGQIAIPVLIRNRLHLQPGDVLEFDENTPFLKATKAIDPRAWDQFGREAVDPWKGRGIHAVIDELRGPVELPPAQDRGPGLPCEPPGTVPSGSSSTDGNPGGNIGVNAFSVPRRKASC